MKARFYPCLYQDVHSRREEVAQFIAQGHELKVELGYRLIHNLVTKEQSTASIGTTITYLFLFAIATKAGAKDCMVDRDGE